MKNLIPAWILDSFRRPTPIEHAARELAQAELTRLEYLTNQEFAAAMAEFEARRITRLRNFLKANSKAEE